jgi:FkbM family methyltransferase
MTEIKSKVRAAAKPVLFKLMGKRFYKYAQFYGKMRDIKYRMIDEKEMPLLNEFIKPGDTVLDLGANFAYYTERLSGIVGTNGKVYAFEPIPFTFEVFKMLVKKFSLKNVTYYNRGVSDKNEIVQFRVPKMEMGTLSTGQAHLSGRKNDVGDKEHYPFTQEEMFNCEVIALDDFFKVDLPGLSFIKIDIEGAELFALKGAKQLLQKYTPAILIEINPVFLDGFGLTSEDMLNFIKEAGYEIFYLNEQIQKLEPLLNKPLWESNFILIHQDKINAHLNIIANVQK